MRLLTLCCIYLAGTPLGLSPSSSLGAADGPATRVYENRLTPLANPQPLLADYPEFVEPIREAARFEAPVLVDDPDADLHVRAWRFSYNARGIIELPNRLRAAHTAVIVVHPWGIDDGQGWTTPEPAGVAFACTPAKNRIALKHVAEVVNPFLKALRGKVGLVAYSLPGREDPIRKKLYRSFRGHPSAAERNQGVTELAAKLNGFRYRGGPVPERLTVAADRPAVDYFRQFPGLDPGARYNNAGFWDLPIPVARPIEVDPHDLVIYDAEGYGPLKQFLQGQGIRHVLLAGYHTDMCVCRTTAGYQNLAKDFDVFLVGDATQATFPANHTPRFATTAAVSFAALDLLITQVSWVKYQAGKAAPPAPEPPILRLKHLPSNAEQPRPLAPLQCRVRPNE
jgi:nicotinamidase-related amidase